MSNKLPHCLLFLRFSVALVLIVWTIDKFINIEHATKVYEVFYFMPGINANIMTVIGIAETILIVLFIAGRFKSITYLAVLIIHAVSTLTPMLRYFDPFNGNLLFFAAWPMLAACYTLYVLRDHDIKFNF